MSPVQHELILSLEEAVLQFGVALLAPCWQSPPRSACSSVLGAPPRLQHQMLKKSCLGSAADKTEVRKLKCFILSISLWLCILVYKQVKKTILSHSNLLLDLVLSNQLSVC